MPNMNFLSLTVQKFIMAKVKSFRYVSQRSPSRPLGQNFLHDWKDFNTRNVQVKYENSTSNGSKVMAKVKVF